MIVPFIRPGGLSLARNLARLASVFVLVLLAFAPLAALAQVPGNAPAASEESAPPKDVLGRETPEGLVRGLVRAMAEQDYVRAAEFFDLSAIPAARRAARGQKLAQDFQKILDEGGWLAAGRDLSSAPEGNLDDGLAPDLERFASVRTGQGTVALFARRGATQEGMQIWRIAPQSVALIPDLLENVESGLLERYLPAALSGGPRVLGVPLSHWGALLAFAAAAYVAAGVLVAVAALGLRLVWRHKPQSLRVRLLNAAVPPLRICLAVWIFALGGIYLGVAVVARQMFGVLAEVVGWIGLTWFLWRIIDAIGAESIDRISQRNQWEALSAIRFFRRVAKFLVIAAAVILVLDTFGFNVSAGLAALGIGGLAVALGAQKTMENLIGSVTLIADHPIREGDFCRFGNGTLGLVEEIGMRSTRIRTLDRTIITVPNGEFSSMQIENFAVRDKFWFHPTLSLRYETTPDQIRYLLVELRSLLYSHPKVDPDPARVRFTGLGADSLTMEIFAYIKTTDINEFLEVQEDLTLRIMDIVTASGTGFAFPSQTIYMARDPKPDEAARRMAEEKVEAMRQAREMPLPRFKPENIDALRGKIPYPPEGSVDSLVAPPPKPPGAEDDEPRHLPAVVKPAPGRIGKMLGRIGLNWRR